MFKSPEQHSTNNNSIILYSWEWSCSLEYIWFALTKIFVDSYQVTRKFCERFHHEPPPPQNCHVFSHTNPFWIKQKGR